MDYNFVIKKSYAWIKLKMKKEYDILYSDKLCMKVRR